MGRGVPSPSDYWGSRKWISCIFQVRKKSSGTPFSVFLSDGGAPKRRGFPLSPHLYGRGGTWVLTAWLDLLIYLIVMLRGVRNDSVIESPTA